MTALDPRAAGTAPGDRASEPPRRSGRRLSALLTEAAACAGDRVPVGGLVELFGVRAFGALMFVFAVPNALPVAIPGISLLTGLPLILLTAQLAADFRRPWLPKALRARSFARADFRALIARATPPLMRVEALIRPRLRPVTARIGRRALGVIGLLLAVTLFLPLPFGNTLPGVGLSLIALALLERDGVVALAGAVIGVTGMALASAFLYGATMVALHALLGGTDQ